MKLIVRTLIILAAGAAVAGALLAFGSSSFATQMRAAGPGAGHFERGAVPPGDSAGRPEGDFAGRGGDDHHDPSLAGLVTVVETLAKIGALVALVALGARLLGRRRRDEPGQGQPAAPTTGPTTRL